MTQLLLIAAFICFVFDALGVNSRVGLTPLGLALWVLLMLIR
jgi:hypothetical protein